MKNPNNHKDAVGWFIERIGKRVYRPTTSCPCEVCKDVEENGVVVADELHAHYLADVAMEFPVDYYDTKEEVPINN